MYAQIINRRVFLRRRLALLIVLTLIALFLIHAWRQSHTVGNRLEEELRSVRVELERQVNRTKKQLQPQLYDPRFGAVTQPLEKELIDPEGELFDRMIVFDAYVPPSQVTCTGRNATDRVCRIKNFCYDPTRNLFFILKSATSAIDNGKLNNETRLVDGTSIDGHNRFYIDYVEASPQVLANRPVHWVDKPVYVVARFHRMNIMHTMHDDLLGLFNLAKLHGPSNAEDPSAPFSLDTHVFFSDWYGREHYDYLYRIITKHPVQYRSHWQRSTTDPLCMAEAIVGNHKLTAWYNYGFLEPQAPIQGKQVNGWHIRDAARYLMRRVGVAKWPADHNAVVLQRLTRDAKLRLMNDQYKPEYKKPVVDSHFVTIFVRTWDRLIVNLKELEHHLAMTYGLPVRQVRMEDQTITEQILTLRTTMVAVGLHGSALIMAMWLPRGAVLVELFPFRVPAKNYTPYKTMCQLPGMDIIYRAWENHKEENTRTFPERDPGRGGLVHLNDTERARVEGYLEVPPHLCCRDPVWLFRIYQDTIVDLRELTETIDDGLIEAGLRMPDLKQDIDGTRSVDLVPAAPDVVECQVTSRYPLGSKEALSNTYNPLDMTISWSPPWNLPPGDLKVRKFGVWVHQYFREFFTDPDADSDQRSVVLEECPPGTTFDIWVRSYKLSDDRPGVYSDRYQCTCEIGAVAKKVIVESPKENV